MNAMNNAVEQNGFRIEEMGNFDRMKAVMDFANENDLVTDNLGWLSDKDTAANVGTTRDELTHKFVPEGDSYFYWYAE